MLFKGWRRGVVGLLVAFAFQAGAAAAAAPDSARLGRAKDYIADEQWTRAIAELRTVVADPKDKSRDEALYWLAHSLNQAGDSAAAITTIRRLEREYPTSLWVKPPTRPSARVALLANRPSLPGICVFSASSAKSL